MPGKRKRSDSSNELNLSSLSESELKKALETKINENKILKKKLEIKEKKIDKLERRAKENNQVFHCSICDRNYANRRSFK